VADHLIWIDCEMTGLNLAHDALVEIAAIVTDGELNPVGEGVEAVIKPPAAAIELMSDYVREMHANSGLLSRLDGGISLAEAEEAVMTYIRAFIPEARKAPLAGNSVGMDRLFISRDMPALDAHLHYRVVDVSSIKELARRWYPKTYFSAPAKTGNHRALGDIQDSINELRYYREALFIPAPGLDSERARAIAERYGETERDR
jgi:oligoribonuclease